MEFIEHIPDLTYTFGAFYNPDGSYTFGFLLWREFLHLLGGTILAVIIFFVRKYNTRIALALSGGVVGYFLYQELWLHPTAYNQPLWKGSIDLVSWLVPLLGIYLFSKNRPAS